MSCSCIIAFYNEPTRILGVLKIVTRIKEFKKIVCVDDGSTDNFHVIIGKKYPNIKFIRFDKNRGKSAAIEVAINEIDTEFVFLIDGDLINLNPAEIKKAITILSSNPSISMMILTRIHTNIQGTWQRANCVFSGERILRMEDLKNVFKMKPKPVRYQLEVAINQYMIDNHRQVCWIKSSAINHFKRTKYGGFVKGEIKDLQMHFQMMKYVGFKNYLYQILFFCREEFKNIV